MNLGRKLTSLNLQVQLPIYNVHAIMHGLHDLTGNDDSSLKGESLTKTDVHSMTHTSPLIYYHLPQLPDLKPSHSFIRI